MYGDDSHDGELEQSGKRSLGHSSTSRRQFLKATAGASALAAGVGSNVVGSASAAGIPTPWLHRDGNLIKDPQGNKVVLRGVNIADPARLNDKDRRYHVTAEQVTKWALDESNGWYNRIIRIPAQSGDIVGAGSNSVPPGTMTHSDVESYVENHLRPVVDICKERGAYCIIDYHRHDDAQLLYTDDALDEEVRMFWETVAPKFADESHVLFEVYNEPIAPYPGHNTWNGGVDVTAPEAKETWETWKGAAQPWVDTIREHAPRNIIIIGSPRWSQWTYWAAESEFEGDNLAYAGHVYAHPNLRPLSEYFGTPAEEVPVFMTEFGYDDEGQDYIKGTTSKEGQQFKEFFEEYDSVHWQAWCFDTRWEPAMFDGEQGEWTLLGGEEFHGEFFKEYLQEKKDDDLPGGGDDTDTPTPAPPTDAAPPAPSNLSVSETTRSSISLTWNGSDRAVDYVVTWGRPHDTGFTEKAVETTSTTIDGLSAGATYDIDVVARNVATNSETVSIRATTAGGSTKPSVSVELATDSVSPDGTVDASITLSNAPDGLAGYTVAVSVGDASIATVAGASYPDAFGMTEDPQIASDGSSVTLKAVDVEDQITAGATDVELATVTLSAEATGETTVGVAVEAMDADGGGLVEPTTTAGTLSVGSTTVEKIEGDLPQDPDGDGHYEDLNGNGRIDADDVVTYFEYKDDAAITDHVDAYDYNGNGRIDFDDVASLFDEV